MAAERGRQVAETECGRCHGLGLTGESLRTNAPPFRAIRPYYNDLVFRRRMEEIAEGGHYEMPPLRLDPGEVRDVAAYIESLSPL
jgi:cytochrome c